jgi:hypothetical protein
MPLDRSSTVSLKNFTAVPYKVHRHLVLNHTIKYAGDPDDDGDTGVETRPSQAQHKL